MPGAKTFRWRGKYQPNMNDRETLEVHLNVFEKFNPKLNDEQRQSRFVFLANGSPIMQLGVLEQVANPALAVCDTMDLWINIQRDELMKLLQRIDGLVMNDSEAKLLTQDENLVRAGLDQRWQVPDRAAMPAMAYRMARVPSVAARMLPLLARGQLLYPMGGRYPIEADVVALGRWNSRVERLLGPLPS